MRDARPFVEFMDDALYGDAGFYRTGGVAGRRGDFITSPEVGPLFGAVVASFLDREWERLGRPQSFTVVDAGAGPGTLARALLAAEPECTPAMRLVAVERSPEQRERHPEAVESSGELPAERFDGVIIANELLDNLPFRLAVYDDGWREAYAVDAGDGTLVEQLGPPLDPVPAVLPPRAVLGARAPLHDAAYRWVQRARGLLRRGTLVAVDYTSPTTSALASRPWRDWLRTYRAHGRGGHYLADPGQQDITCEVAIDQLPAPDSVTPQADWLRRHGIEAFVAAGRRHWEDQQGPPDLEAMRMRSRVSEAEALLDPAGLGGFTVCEWRTTTPAE